jgi:4-hydroxy-tetrahydrodipicolinate synthase
MLTAMVTPFAVDGSLDTESAGRLATELIDDCGHDGLIICGTTGESPTLTDPEQDALLTAVVEAVGDRAHIVAGVGTNDTAHSVERSVAAEKIGAHGLLAVTPYYNKPPQAGIVAHFRAIADSTGLPVLLYDIPARTGTKLSAATLTTLSEHDRIVAVKEASGDLCAGSWLMATTGLAVYSGDDALNLAWLALGACGLVSVVGHLAGLRYRDLIDAVQHGDLGRAREINNSLLPAVAAVMTRTQGAIMVKAALELQGRIAHRTVRAPLIDATTEQITELARDLVDAGLLDDPPTTHAIEDPTS